MPKIFNLAVPLEHQKFFNKYLQIFMFKTLLPWKNFFRFIKPNSPLTLVLDEKKSSYSFSDMFLLNVDKFGDKEVNFKIFLNNIWIAKF